MKSANEISNEITKEILKDNLKMPFVTNIQYPVGQGGLHYSVINLGDRYFVYLYDCGSVNSIKKCSNSIKDLKDSISKIANKITDFYIFISHLHKDHYSFLKTIIKFLKKINSKKEINIKIILPYLSDTEKIILISEYDETQEFEDDEFDYINFILDPKKEIDNYFKDLKIVVQFIRHHYDVDKNNDSNELSNFVYPNFPENDGEIISDNQEWHFQKELQIIWMLKIYMPEVDNEVLNKFADKIEYYKQFFDLSSENWLIEVFERKNNRYCNTKVEQQRKNLLESLRKIYETITIDINETSMCLYSGNNSIYYSFETLIDEVSNTSSSVGWMHTGDSNLIKNGESFYNFYRNNLCNVKVFQIPHHGSKLSCNQKTLDKYELDNYYAYYVTNQEHPHSKQPDIKNNDYNITIKSITEKSEKFERTVNFALEMYEYKLIPKYKI